MKTYLAVMQGARKGEGLRTHIVQAENPQAAVLAAFGSAAKLLVWEPLPVGGDGYRVFNQRTEEMTEGVLVEVEPFKTGT